MKQLYKLLFKAAFSKTLSLPSRSISLCKKPEGLAYVKYLKLIRNQNTKYNVSWNYFIIAREIMIHIQIITFYCAS